MKKFNTLISAKLLRDFLSGNVKNIRVLDSSWHLPSLQRDANIEYAEKHIPKASFFDIDECSDETSQFSHTLPRQSHFEDYVGSLGIGNNTHVIIYDNSETGFFSAPRAWWTFRVFGHQSISLLNGGFPQWCLAGYPTASEKPSFTKQTYSASINKSMLKSFDDIARNIENREFQLVDARGTGRFYGTTAEPRKGMPRGHIVGSVSIPYSSIIDPETKQVKNPADLKRMFTDGKIDLEKPVTATCGSGVTACCLALAGHLCGRDIPVYDGSWSEWSVRSEPHQRVSPTDAEA
ncbi:3-mercaptopyruvate sulfurtransferase-like [Mizuhopecten yessoensis]|uniref:3-mercaptopyruvate sulfurtransferase n=1 Tax=Mizuhopecten yessoensis TaxID=6573 RepID=A0A210QUW0_MIZYE|nr:3-mercaptopyruvate sulfurtransferase-like [Mizuhopecten yessoensis]OWF52524.1 3-mercaptopyruvate sulfurtransferase [Mizuhopecten yessoensis]